MPEGSGYAREWGKRRRPPSGVQAGSLTAGMQLEALFRAIGNTDNAIQPGSGIVPLTPDSSTAIKCVRTCVEAIKTESVRETIGTFNFRESQSFYTRLIFWWTMSGDESFSVMCEINFVCFVFEKETNKWTYQSVNHRFRWNVHVYFKKKKKKIDPYYLFIDNRRFWRGENYPQSWGCRIHFVKHLGMCKSMKLVIFKPF